VGKLARQTTAAIHREDDCILYRFTTELDRQNRFILTELWESEDVFETARHARECPSSAI
jgi:quinol monooxygenase YgiN